MFKNLAEFILFGSIFISLCAVALCIETNVLLHLRLNALTFYFFVFGSTLVQYNLHYLVKKNAVQNSRRLIWSLKNRLIHKILIALGFLLIIISLFNFHFYHFIILLFFGAIAFLYSFPLLPFTTKRIKDFGLLKIITLALLWTLVTVWLPIAKANFSDFTFQLIFIRRFIFIFVVCLLFDIRDLEIDKQKNISTLAVILCKARSYFLIYLLLITFIILSAIQLIYFPNVFEFCAMVISAIATLIIIEISKKNKSDFIYLAGIDGMLFLQAVLVIFASVIQ